MGPTGQPLQMFPVLDQYSRPVCDPSGHMEMELPVSGPDGRPAQGPSGPQMLDMILDP